jgi:hypothetical protein
MPSEELSRAEFNHIIIGLRSRYARLIFTESDTDKEQVIQQTKSETATAISRVSQTAVAPGSSPGPGSGGIESGSSPGLSQGASIAIAVLAAIIGLMAIYIALSLYRRRGRSQLPPPASASPHLQTQELHEHVAVSGAIRQLREVRQIEMEA